jgi:hypothetical protein
MYAKIKFQTTIEGLVFDSTFFNPIKPKILSKPTLDKNSQTNFEIIFHTK